jgi:hypothetical protein
MIYQIVSPVYRTIEGDSFKEAIKNYVKFDYNLNIRNLIIKDQLNNKYEAKLRYYMQNQRNKVGIDVYPYVAPVAMSPSVAIAPVPIAPVAMSPIITTRNSPFYATANNIVIKRPGFY